jgi:hypothetical protein
MFNFHALRAANGVWKDTYLNNNKEIWKKTFPLSQQVNEKSIRINRYMYVHILTHIIPFNCM